jgi:hypothetical protein
MQMMAACDYAGTLQALPPQLATADSQYGAGSHWSVYSSLHTASMYDAGHGGLAAQQQGSMLTSSALQQGRQQGRAIPPAVAKRRCGRPKAANPLDDPTIPEKKARR